MFDKTLDPTKSYGTITILFSLSINLNCTAHNAHYTGHTLCVLSYAACFTIDDDVMRYVFC